MSERQKKSFTTGVHSTALRPKSDPQEEVTIERLERGLAFLAYLIELGGPVHAPLFEKLERELEAMRARENTVVRAKKLLESYSGRPPFLSLPPPSE
jgi:hypothetical protein